MSSVIIKLFTIAMVVSLSWSVSAAPPGSYQSAKQMLKENVYFDHNQSDFGTLYCGCSWQWVGRSGGRVDLEGCGFNVRARPNRAERTEYEHIVPAHSLGHQRQCWQRGGRKDCVANDAVFQAMYVDLYNLTPVVGEFNADRSNYRFSQLPRSAPFQHGQCASRIDFAQRVVDPRPKARGLIARTYFYMHERYNLPMSRAQQQLFMAWDRQYPVSDWERTRHDRIAAVMGHPNPFVTGAKQWTLGRVVERSEVSLAPPTSPVRQTALSPSPAPVGQRPIHGNRNSNIYHLPEGCPSYNAMADRNRVIFDTEDDAVSAGYRKAGNCR